MIPARSRAPTGVLGSTTSSMWSPWCSSRTRSGPLRGPGEASEDARVDEGDGAMVHVPHQRAALDPVGGDVGMRRPGQRDDVVEEAPHPRHHPLAPALVVGPGRRRVTEGVGAVESVVQRAPAGVGGVDGVAGVGDGNDQLGAGDERDLRVDAGGVDLERFAVGHQVADAFEEGAVRLAVAVAASGGAVPAVDRRLQLVAAGEQGAVARRHRATQSGQAIPEGVGADAASGQRFILDELDEGAGDVQRGSGHVAGPGRGRVDRHGPRVSADLGLNPRRRADR